MSLAKTSFLSRRAGSFGVPATRTRTAMQPLRAAGLGLLALIALPACKSLENPPPAPFFVYVRVEGDPGTPLPGATVSRGSKLLATAGPDGRAMLTLNGNDGDNIDVVVKCPETFQSPTKPTAIKLTRFSDAKRVPEYLVSCPPMFRHVVVAVRAENGANLPVKYLDREVARTDASGAAHFVLDLAPGGQFQVALDTTESPKIKPQNPARVFSVGQADAVMVFDQKFAVERPVPVYMGPRRVVGPRRL